MARSVIEASELEKAFINEKKWFFLNIGRAGLKKYFIYYTFTQNLGQWTVLLL